METARGEMHWMSQAPLLGTDGCGSGTKRRSAKRGATGFILSQLLLRRAFQSRSHVCGIDAVPLYPAEALRTSGAINPKRCTLSKVLLDHVSWSISGPLKEKLV